MRELIYFLLLKALIGIHIQQIIHIHEPIIGQCLPDDWLITDYTHYIITAHASGTCTLVCQRACVCMCVCVRHQQTAFSPISMFFL